MVTLFITLLLLVTSCVAQEHSGTERLPPRWVNAQKYAARGFHPVDCFAGQVKIHGKPVVKQHFSVLRPNADMKCCGTIVQSGQTDNHGHFFVEPMQQDEYFAQFDLNGAQHVTSFAVLQSYKRCDVGTHVEINFSTLSKAEVQTYVDIDDSGDPCEAAQPGCFRK